MTDDASRIAAMRAREDAKALTRIVDRINKLFDHNTDARGRPLAKEKTYDEYCKHIIEQEFDYATEAVDEAIHAAKIRAVKEELATDD